MRKHYVKHENLRNVLEEMRSTLDDLSEATIDRFANELKHSNLIIACDLTDVVEKMPVIETDGVRYGFLFTDMDELRKFPPANECDSHAMNFCTYRDMVEQEFVDGFILNPESEDILLIKEMFTTLKELPKHKYSADDAYSAGELKSLKDSINNTGLEKFIENPENIGDYEGLFSRISSSTLLTLMLSYTNLSDIAEDGVVSIEKTGPVGFLYTDDIGGKYATVYTSEDKIRNVTTSLNKNSQIVNFSQLTNFILNDDMDGIIINPNSDNVLLTRDVLLEYWALLEDTCNDPKLNGAFLHMFPMEEECL